MQITINAPLTPTADSSEHASITITTQVPNTAGGSVNQIVSNSELVPGVPVTLNLAPGNMVAVAVYRLDTPGLPLPVSFPPPQNPTA